MNNIMLFRLFSCIIAAIIFGAISSASIISHSYIFLIFDIPIMGIIISCAMILIKGKNTIIKQTMDITQIKNLKRGDWFTIDGDLCYVARDTLNGFLYSSPSFHSTYQLYIGYDDDYGLIHKSMGYIGKTKENFLYWIMPMFIAQFMHPFKTPDIKL